MTDRPMTDEEFRAAMDYHEAQMRYWFGQAAEAFTELDALVDQQKQVESDK